MVRRSSRLAALAPPPPPLEAWGFRSPSARAAQQDYDDVLLSQDLQAALLDTVGLNGIGLGAICKSWAAVVAGRGAKEWNVLKYAPEKCFGQGLKYYPYLSTLSYPYGMASLPGGALCVTDAHNHRLQIFPKDQGAAPRVIGSNGRLPGQLQYPFGVACDNASLFVSDSDNNRVQKLRLADGAHLGTVGKAGCLKGDGQGQFNWPTSLCVAAGQLYVCDSYNGRIVVLGTDLSWRYTFGRRGSGDGEFSVPTAVAAHGDELYVVDLASRCDATERNHRVQARCP